MDILNPQPIIAPVKTTTCLFSFLLLGNALAEAEDAAPALNARQALTLAEKALADKGMAGQVYIKSLALTRPTLSSNDRWQVAWSSAIEGSKPGSREVGLEISMAGDVVHLIKGRGEVQKVAAPH